MLWSSDLWLHEIGIAGTSVVDLNLIVHRMQSCGDKSHTLTVGTHWAGTLIGAMSPFCIHVFPECHAKTLDFCHFIG